MPEVNLVILVKAIQYVPDSKSDTKFRLSMLHWLLSTDPNWLKYVSYKTDKFAEHQVKTTCLVDTDWSGL